VFRLLHVAPAKSAQTLRHEGVAEHRTILDLSILEARAA
jgi:hypothetical protein